MSARWQRLFKSAGLNTIAFGLIVAVQQLFIFPSLGRIVSVSAFSEAILFVTFAMVFVNIVGGEVVNVSLLRGKVYQTRDLPWDSLRIAVVGMGIGLIGVCVAIATGWLSASLAIQYLVVIVLGTARTVGLAPDKYIGRFGSAALVSVAYSIGGATGLVLVQVCNSAVIPFVTAEVMAVVAMLVLTRRRGLPSMTLRRTPEYSRTIVQYGHLAMVALIMNSISYLDRIIIAPLLGAPALAVYYAASALSKSFSMVSNPLANTFLARLASIEDDSRNGLFSSALKLALPVFICTSVASYAVSYFGLQLLYPDFFAPAIQIILPVTFAAALGVVGDLFRPLVLRFAPSSRVLGFYVAYALFYLLLIGAMAQQWGLEGFAWAGVIARLSILCMFLIQSFIYQSSPPAQDE